MHSVKLMKKCYIRCTVAGLNRKEAKLMCKLQESKLFNYGNLEVSPFENFGITNYETAVSTFSIK